MNRKILLIAISFCLLAGNHFIMAQEISKQLVTAFGQSAVHISTVFESCTGDSKQGNCAAIALIKAAMGQYKTLNQIYSSFIIRGNTFDIKFNDGVEVTVSNSDVDTAKKYSGILKLDNAAYYDSAMIIFASICQRVIVNKPFFKDRYLKDKVGYNNTDCIKTFNDAVDYVDSGYPTVNVGDFLGLSLEPVSKSDLQTQPSLIINDRAHAAYCSYGIQDINGKSYKIKRGRMENPLRNFFGIKTGRITGVYKLKK